ncbi:MAG: hypothetical protein OXC95_13215 [Dehalococcoidia bacterium]|nr:hypothetical protein [Dehalococcoidia bacterium]
MNTKTNNTVMVSVELFGHARTVSGVRDVQISLPPQSGASDLAAALAAALPSLRSIALEDDGSSLLSSYTANLNGLAFMDDEPVPVSPGDTILLFSSQAGG